MRVCEFVVELFLGDLNKDEDSAYQKTKVRIDEVHNKNCLTNFCSMDFTFDELRSLVRKWQTLIEVHIEVEPANGYLLRLFAIHLLIEQMSLQW